jgi:ATP-dependent Lon protease
MESTNYSKPLPVLALRNLVLFPGTTVPIRVGRAQSIAAIRALRNENTDGDKSGSQQLIAVLQIPLDQKEHISPDELHPMGVLVQIERVRGNEKDGFQLVVRGLERVRVRQVFESGGALRAIPEPVNEPSDVDQATQKTLLDSVKGLAKQILEFFPAGSDQMVTLVDGISDLDFMVNIVAANIDISTELKQELLAETSVKARAMKLLDLMRQRRDELKVQTEIRDKMTSKLGKNQREAILREQMKAIQEELGDDSDGPARSEDYRKKIDESGMPENVRKVALDELRRLESLGQQSPETHVIRNYLDLLVAMPWKTDEEATIDLKKARETLDADHYGLDKIKKMKLKEGGRGLILMFSGPPGVGKTSLGQSIAKSLGRKFVRVSLGGVRDDSEIRGHRRTYVGAMPGRIIQGLKRAGSMNPVFLLDEIDKLGRGYQGDPAAALLEVLDPEQNATFTDHYMDVPYDLSKVLFIATANSLESIPGPLLDRMEVIELSGYTSAEKHHIAKNHLLPKQLDDHGIKPEQLTVTDEAIGQLISHYTREAGVRDLQRKLAAICRTSTTKIVEGAEKVEVGLPEIEESLGPVRFDHEVTEKQTPPGVVTGLAWTPVGGEILFIESALMPGNGKLTLTGQLGDVMKESAQIALSLIRSRLPQVSASLEFDKKDLHIHVPSGAIPKDGPSAGIALLTSIASLFTGRPVDSKTAMTGEVTLRGAVTPVGGIKEKVMAAHRAGVTRVILARKNERDLRDVPEEVKSKMKFHLVDDVAEVLRLSLGLEIPAMDPNTGLWGVPMPAVGPGGAAPMSVA